MATIKRFEDLKSWQEARKLCQSIYKEILANELFDELARQSISIEKMISGLVKHLNSSDFKGSKFKEEEAPYGNLELET